MSNLPPDAKAMRQEIYVAVVTFVFGFVAVLSASGWAIVHFVTPDARWWEVVHASFTAILISLVFGGLGSAALSTWLVSVYHYTRGAYHCLFCGRTLKSRSDHCDCRGAGLTQKDRKGLFPGGFSKPLCWALFAYAALVPLAYLIAIEAPGRKGWPLWSFTAVMHALLCAVVAACGKVLVSISDHWIPNSRLKPHTGHIQNFIALLAIWPLCIAILMAFWKYGHG